MAGTARFQPFTQCLQLALVRLSVAGQMLEVEMGLVCSGSEKLQQGEVTVARHTVFFELLTDLEFRVPYSLMIRTGLLI